MRSALLGTLAAVATAVNGPAPIMRALGNRTFYATSPGGVHYELKFYDQITQLGSQNISLGLFHDYAVNNGIYAYHQYVGGSTSGGCTPRSLNLILECADEKSLSTVIEYPPCNYFATYNTPDVCGIDMTVGQELATISATPTPSSTPNTFQTIYPSVSALLS